MAIISPGFIGVPGASGGAALAAPVNVLSITTATPPGAPSEGDTYIIPATGATGAWVGHDNEIAVWSGASWVFRTPIEGWQAYISDEDEYYGFIDPLWVLSSPFGTGSEELINGLAWGDVTITWDDGTTVFTIAPVGTTFDVWVKSVKYSKTTETLTGDGTDFAIAEGIWYLYYDAAGVLTASQTPWSFENNAPVAFFYWDATNSKALLSGLFDERHGSNYPWSVHMKEHLTLGTAFQEGLDLTALLDQTGASDTHAQVALSDGTLWDEDLEIPIVDGAGSGRFEQELDPIAELPVLYRSTAAGLWREKVANTYPLYETAGRVNYNNIDAGGAGVWGLTEVANGKFTDSIIVGSNSFSQPVAVILGQATYNTLNDARNADPLASFDLTDLPFEEIRYLYRIIIQTSDGYGNAVKARFRSPITDYRKVDLGSPAAVTLPTDHQALSNRDADGAHPATAVELDTTSFGGNLAVADDAAQDLADKFDIFTRSLAFAFDNSGAVLGVGEKHNAVLEVPFNCEIVAAVLVAGESGSIQIDLWKTTYALWEAGVHPVNGDSIVAAAPPSIAAAEKSIDTTLTAWTKTLTKGDLIVPVIDSVTSLKWVKLILRVKAV